MICAYEGLKCALSLGFNIFYLSWPSMHETNQPYWLSAYDL